MLNVTQVKGSRMGSMIYVLSLCGSNNCYLVDIGDYHSVEKVLPSGSVVKGVFITHGHYDHIAGINELIHAFPKCCVYASYTGREMLASPKQNLSYYIGSPLLYDGVVNIIKDKDVIRLWNGINLNVVATPGHNPSCLSFIVEKYLFTGDSYIPGLKVVTNLPKSNSLLAKSSVNTLKSLAKNRKICPGHEFPN